MIIDLLTSPFILFMLLLFIGAIVVAASGELDRRRAADFLFGEDPFDEDDYR